MQLAWNIVAHNIHLDAVASQMANTVLFAAVIRAALSVLQVAVSKLPNCCHERGQRLRQHVRERRLHRRHLSCRWRRVHVLNDILLLSRIYSPTCCCMPHAAHLAWPACSSCRSRHDGHCSPNRCCPSPASPNRTSPSSPATISEPDGARRLQFSMIYIAFYRRGTTELQCSRVRNAALLF